MQVTPEEIGTEARPVSQPHAFRLTIPPPKMLTSQEELAMARAAYSRQPHDPAIRYRLASMLSVLDHFDEALAVLEQGTCADVRELLLLVNVLVSRERPEDDRRALEACQRALPRASAQQSVLARKQLAKIHTRLGNYQVARHLLEELIQEAPQEKDVYKRLFRQYLEFEQDAPAALAFAERMIAHGVVHARVLGSWVLALARLGRLEEAHQAEGTARFLVQVQPDPPAGWSSLQELNAALMAETLQHPDMRYDRYGTASARTWRLDEPALHSSKVVPALQELVRREVQTYVDGLRGIEHPFAAAIPAQASLRNWCVITEGDGYELPHVHQNGWLSGVYYIHVQEHIAKGLTPAGCIAFGLPESLVGQETASAYGEQLVRPHSGLMVLFPSHVYHRTFPHHGDGKRICFAFDIIPAA